MEKEFMKLLGESKEESEIIAFIEKFPQVLDTVDKQGISYYTMLAYYQKFKALKEANNYKRSWTFYENIIAGKHVQIKEALMYDATLLNSYSPDGFPPLTLAVFFGQDKIAYHLLEKGADITLTASNPSKVNALHSAIAKNNLPMSLKLLEAGIDVNAVQTEAVTALHSAAHRGNLEMVELLLKHGADISLKMENGETPLMIATREKHDDIIPYLQ